MGRNLYEDIIQEITDGVAVGLGVERIVQLVDQADQLAVLVIDRGDTDLK